MLKTIIYMAEKLYRSRKSKILGGVCGGMAEYFNVDPVIIRILWILLCIFSAGIGIVAYIICWIIIPLEPQAAFEASAREVNEPEEKKEQNADEKKRGDGGLLVIGSFFVCLGFLWMIAEQFHVGNFGGMAAILVGFTVIVYWVVERR